MASKQWGEKVWEEKIKYQDEKGVIFGTNSSIKQINKNTKRHISMLKEHFLTYIKKNGKILDAGIGPMARFSIEFSKLGYKVTGVDISKTTLKYAKKNIDKKKLDVKLIRDNLLELKNIKNNEFDMVFCIETFGHIPSYLSLEVLKNFNKKLKKGAYCLIEFWIEEEKGFKKLLKDFLYWSLHNIKKKFKKTFHVNCSFYTHEEILDMVERTGFKFIKKEKKLYLFKKIK